LHSLNWLGPMPSKKREKPHQGSWYPTHTDDGCKNTIKLLPSVCYQVSCSVHNQQPGSRNICDFPSLINIHTIYN
jgi:hypothetical protein